MAPSGDGRKLAEFGPFCVDLFSRELRKNGMRLRLEEKPALVLCTLIERAGTLVTRQELQTLLWPSDVHVDFNHGLNKAVNRLRAVLADDSEQPRYIETLTRKGYRFIGAVEFSTLIPAEVQLDTVPPSEGELRSPANGDAPGVTGGFNPPLPASPWWARPRYTVAFGIAAALLLLAAVPFSTMIRVISASDSTAPLSFSAFKVVRRTGDPAPLPGAIRTLAGDGVGGFKGDGQPATEASLHLPVRLCIDAHGDLYISDYGNSRIRKVERSNGTITTVAGNGQDAFTGDGGPATNASLNHPGGVALDSKGNLYIADSDNHRIRRVEAGTGIITTFAGNGTPGFKGDGNRAVHASLYYPAGVAIDAHDNIFVADLFNNRIRKIDGKSRTISTVAGDGTIVLGRDGVAATRTSLNFPHGIAVDPSGNLYIAEEDNHRIRKVDAATGIITTVAGTGRGGFGGDGGPATNALLYNPRDVTMDQAGNLYIADHRNSRVRKIEAATGLISTVAGNGNAWFSGEHGPATSASLYQPVGVAVDGDGILYIADTYNSRIRVVTTSSNLDVFSQRDSFGVHARSLPR